jgi:hypothetical protein
MLLILNIFPQFLPIIRLHLFDMVYTTRDALVNHGISTAHLFSDAFSFEAK